MFRISSQKRGGALPKRLAIAIAGFGLLFASACSSQDASPSPGDTSDGGSTALTVDDGTTFVVSGPQGGPFPSGTRDYRLRNTGTSTLRWSAMSSVPWLRFSKTSGVLDPGSHKRVTVRVDGDFAATLPVGEYPADVLFAGDDYPGGEVILTFLLVVRPNGGELTVTPNVPFEPSGQVGGDVNPRNITYTVQNTGSEAVDWRANNSAAWATMSGTTRGNLAAGASATLLLTVDNSQVDSLGAGVHTGVLRFFNETNERGNTERTLSLTLTPDNSGGPRVTDRLVALYTFEEGSGNVVRDRSPNGAPLNLVIDDPSRVTWDASSLRVDAPTRVATSGPANKITNAVTGSNEVTLEAWVEPANLTQDGPARILSLSGGTGTRNFTVGQGLWMGQPSDVIDVRLRTTATDDDGLPSMTSSAGSLPGGLTHIVFTREASGTTRTFINGDSVASDVRGGNFSNWASNFSFILANEASGDRPWLGSFHLVSIYEKALDVQEVQQNFAAGPGIADAGNLAVTPGSGYGLSGQEGGTFAPNSKTYTLTNTGSVAIDWNASASESWVRVAGTNSGQLAPGESVDVLVRSNQSQIQGFQPGSYYAALTFLNTTDGYGSTERDVALIVHSQNTGGDVTIVPGTGFTGPTPEPGQIGSGTGADAKAIARWDVVPYQDFSADFNIGVVAFHMNDISRVEFSCEGGPWVAATEMTVNPRTQAAEYWGTLPAAAFNQDGLVEVRAIAYPEIGRPRLLESLWLNCNVGGTLPSEVRWVSTSGSDSGSGSASSPFRTIWKAASSIHDAQGGNAGGGTVYLLPGNYNLPDKSGGPAHTMPVTTTRWLTVSGAPGTTRNQVTVNQSDAQLTKRTHVRGVTIRTVIYAHANYQPDIWAQDVEMTYQGQNYGQNGGTPYPPHLRGNPDYWFDKVYQTDCYIHHARDNNWRTTLERNILVENLISQGIKNPRGLIVNLTVNGINASGTPDHPDMVHFQGPHAENVILFNIKMLNCGAQGIFARNNTGGPENHYKDIAFVNVVLDNHPHYWQSDWSVSTDHLLWWNVSSPYQKVVFQSYEFPVTLRNFSIRDSIFYRLSSFTPTVHDNNHYFDAQFSNPLGTNATTGGLQATMFVAPDAVLPNFTPLLTSPLSGRVQAPRVSVDVENAPRLAPAAIGAYAATDLP